MFKIHAPGSSLDFTVYATLDELMRAVKKSLADEGSGTFFSDLRVLHRSSTTDRWQIVDGLAPWWRPVGGTGSYVWASEARSAEEQVEYVLFYDGEHADACYAITSL